MGFCRPSLTRSIRYVIIAGLAFDISVFHVAAAQETKSKIPIKISGSLSSYGEMYSISGIERRRPSSTARILFSPKLSIYEVADISFEFILSTEDRTNRQQISQFGAAPSWRWGKAYLGDFTETYSPLTLSGVKVRGAGISVFSSHYRISIIGGFSRRKVGGNSPDKSHRRELFGTRIGIGKESGSHFDIAVLYSNDHLSDDAVGQDSIGIDSARVPEPHENLVAAISLGVKPKGSRFSWDSELAGCVFTRDKRASRIDINQYPDFLDNIVRSRVGTNLDFAWNSSLQFKDRLFSAKAAYDYIGPGYVSLGVESLQPDQQSLSLESLVNRAKWSLTIRTSFQSDNLIDQKIYTTTRMITGAILNVRPYQMTGISLGVNGLLMKNDSADDSTKIEYSNLTMNAGVTSDLPDGLYFHRGRFNYIYQRGEDNNQFNASNNSKSHNLGLGLSISPTQTVNADGGADLIFTKFSDFAWKTTKSFRVMVEKMHLQNMMTSSFSSVLSITENSHSSQNDLSVLYRFGRYTSVKFNIRGTFFSTTEAGQNDFDEWTAGLKILHRF